MRYLLPQEVFEAADLLNKRKEVNAVLHHLRYQQEQKRVFTDIQISINGVSCGVNLFPNSLEEMINLVNGQLVSINMKLHHLGIKAYEQ